MGICQNRIQQVRLKEKKIAIHASLIKRMVVAVEWFVYMNCTWLALQVPKDVTHSV